MTSGASPSEPKRRRLVKAALTYPAYYAYLRRHCLKTGEMSSLAAPVPEGTKSKG